MTVTVISTAQPVCQSYYAPERHHECPEEGITSNAARNGITASLVSLATTSSMEKQRRFCVSIGHVLMRNLPMVQTILVGITIGIFPLTVLAAVQQTDAVCSRGYVFALMWFQTRPFCMPF
ncbi:conjugal transfer protein TraG N-terminal domain-containing protein [Klebsiella pneumoniae]|uniref:conjugal transfer protein TraG N-terminal domain-containing protein n=1 Tax=Klebsiella pneumoniae TaxID=573 RepID=UPI00388FB874